MEDENDVALAEAVYLCFEGASDEFMTSSLFDRIQLKLMALVQDSYNEGYQNGVAAGRGL